MDKIEKALQKLSASERERIKKALRNLQAGKTKVMDIKKLKGRSDIFRLRIGNLRVIYQVKEGKIFVLAIARRNDKTYKIWKFE